MSKIPSGSEFGGDTEIEVFAGRGIEIVSASGYENIGFDNRAAFEDFMRAMNRAADAAFGESEF